MTLNFSATARRFTMKRRTAVLIGDPTTGYGIFIENMLNQMGDLAG